MKQVQGGSILDYSKKEQLLEAIENCKQAA